VLKDYYVREQGNGPAIWKLSLGAPFFDVPFSHVSFFSRKPGADALIGSSGLARFRQALSGIATEEGYQLKSKHLVPIGDKVASRVEFARTEKQPRSLMRCAVQGANICPFFEGDARYIPRVFLYTESTVAGIMQRKWRSKKVDSGCRGYLQWADSRQAALPVI
jgi:hypothetical protein